MLSFNEWLIESTYKLEEKMMHCTGQTKEEKEYSAWEEMMNKTWETIGHIGKYEVILSGHFL